MKKTNVIDERYNDINLFSGDLLIKVADKNDYDASQIIQFDRSHNHDAHFFTVLAASSDTQEVQPGQTIVLQWKNAMVPFYWNDEYLSVTNEDQVEAVVVEDD